MSTSFSRKNRLPISAANQDQISRATGGILLRSAVLLNPLGRLRQRRQRRPISSPTPLQPPFQKRGRGFHQILFPNARRPPLPDNYQSHSRRCAPYPSIHPRRK